MVSVKEQLIKEIQALPEAHAKQMANYLAFLKYQQSNAARQVKEFDETEMAALYAEFADEDRALAELGIAEYQAGLAQEDVQ